MPKTKKRILTPERIEKMKAGRLAMLRERKKFKPAPIPKPAIKKERRCNSPKVITNIEQSELMKKIWQQRREKARWSSERAKKACRKKFQSAAQRELLATVKSENCSPPPATRQSTLLGSSSNVKAPNKTAMETVDVKPVKIE